MNYSILKNLNTIVCQRIREKIQKFESKNIKYGLYICQDIVKINLIRSM